ncbi:MAG: hypothetical protein AAFS04_08935 [Cyanobacteria bacterium J06631_9]
MNRKLARLGLALSVVWCVGCSPRPSLSNSAQPENAETVQADSSETAIEQPIADNTDGIVAVEPSLTSSGASFAVTIKSSETGCDRYANWWEVITEDGTLLYRRILAHSHVDEQPFTRSGGPVEVEADEVVIVRSHMHPTGYQNQAMKGSINAGFEPVTLPEAFASDLAEAEPLPTGCAF